MKHHVVGNHVMGIHVKWGTAVSDFNWFFRMQAGGGSDSMNCVGVIWMPLLLCHVLDLDEN